LRTIAWRAIDIGLTLMSAVRVFVTGGAGFIGSVVVRMLASQGHRVTCLLRRNTVTTRIEGVPYQPAFGDIRDREAVGGGMAGCDAAVHLAGLSSWDQIDSPEMPDVVVGGTRNVLDAAHHLGNLRVVQVSSAAVVSGSTVPRVFDESAPFALAASPGFAYVHAKHAAQAVCEEYSAKGVPVIAVLPAETYGPNDTTLVTASNLLDFIESNPVMVCRGGTSVVHVEDVARGIGCALTAGRPGERYILGGDNVDWRRLAELTLRHAGRRRRIITVPNALFSGATRVLSRLSVPLPYNPKVVPYATRYWYVDASKARHELGATFRSADETIRDTVAWLATAGKFHASRPS
jgi:dihydroflavonol-4-reductase